MGKLSKNEIDFIKIYLSTLILLSIITLIYGTLYFVFGEKQKLFSDTYKTFFITIGIYSYVIEAAVTIMGILIVIKFLRKKLGFLYVSIPCGWFLKFVAPNIWVDIILDVFLLGICSYILFKIRKTNHTLTTRRLQPQD